MVWGGATFDVISRINQMERAYRRGRVGIPRKQMLAELAASRNKRVDLACLHLCGSCGYLLDVDVDASEAPAQPPACPSCEAEAFVDLGHMDSADSIRKAESEDRLLPIGAAKQWSIMATAIAGAGVGAVFGLLFPVAFQYEPNLGPSWFSVTAFALVAAATAYGAFVAFKLPLYAYFHRRRGTRPARWRLPLPVAPPGAPVLRTHSGEAEARGELLRAPISGRRCIGYEVSVLFDMEGDARRPMWVLEEENCGAFAVAGREIEAGVATLEIPLEPIGVPDEALDAALGDFLRTRGLFVGDGDFEFFEALLVPGRECKVEELDSPDGAGPRVMQ